MEQPELPICQMLDDIAEYGSVVVVRDLGIGGWGHTVGLIENFNHPELLCIGRDLDLVADVLDRLCEEIAEGDRFCDGDIFSVAAGLVELIDPGEGPIRMGALAAWFDFYRDRPDLALDLLFVGPVDDGFGEPGRLG